MELKLNYGLNKLELPVHILDLTIDNLTENLNCLDLK